MTETADNPAAGLLDDGDLASILQSDRFKHVLDQAPIGIAVADLAPPERIVYANVEFERLAGLSAEAIIGKGWDVLEGMAEGDDAGRLLQRAIVEDSDHIGAFAVDRNGAVLHLDAWSNQIDDEDGAAAFRLVALASRPVCPQDEREALQRSLADKDLQLRELQHRVKNNLQMITSLIRFEARGMPDGAVGERFERLAGRVGALALLYRALGDGGGAETVDLGIYLSEIASAVMRAHAIEGIRLDLKVDTWPVSINIAMPTGLVVNELMTNSLKHAFNGRDGGEIRLHSLVDDTGCRLLVADDGVGLPPGRSWPTAGKLSALFVRSLAQNAKASLTVSSQPGRGMAVEIRFARPDAIAAVQSSVRTGM